MSKYQFSAARSDAQRQEMERLAERNICIFCPENIHEDPNKIEIETKEWMVKKNRYPYEHTKLHLVLIPKAHIKTLSKLSKTAQAEFFPLISECENKYNLHAYSLGIRSGDKRHTSASIEHLHVHLVVGDTTNPDHEPVRFKMSSRPD